MLFYSAPNKIIAKNKNKNVKIDQVKADWQTTQAYYK